MRVGCIANGIKAPKHYVNDNKTEYEIRNVLSEYECQVKHCRITDGCDYFAYVPLDKVCYLKKATALDALDHENGVMFGPQLCEGKVLSKSLLIIII